MDNKLSFKYTTGEYLKCRIYGLSHNFSDIVTELNKLDLSEEAKTISLSANEAYTKVKCISKDVTKHFSNFCLIYLVIPTVITLSIVLLLHCPIQLLLVSLLTSSLGILIDYKAFLQYIKLSKLAFDFYNDLDSFRFVYTYAVVFKKQETITYINENICD